MKLAILTLGTRGDVQPCIALGLQQAGHTVILGTSKDFENMVRARGIRFAPFQFSVRGLLDAPDRGAAFESKRSAIRMFGKVAPLMLAS